MPTRLHEFKNALDAGKHIQVQDGSNTTVFQSQGKYYMRFNGANTSGHEWQDFIDHADFDDDTWRIIS